MATKATGALTVLDFAYECGRRGAVVSEPVGDNSRYDLIIDNGKQLFRIQVKSSSTKPDIDGVFTVNGTRKVITSTDEGLKVKSIAYEKGELDCLVTKAGGVWFFFPEPHILKSIIEVRPAAAAEDYKWNFGKNRWDVIGLPNDPIQ